MKQRLAIVFACALALAGFYTNAFAITADELRSRIAELSRQIVELQAQLAGLPEQEEIVPQADTVIPGIPEGFVFRGRLEFGVVSEEVHYLQILLNRDPDTQVANSGIGSSGQETNVFGYATKAAVVKFQNKYANDILRPWGFVKGTGLVGSTTRAKLNEILSGQSFDESRITVSSYTPQQADTIVVSVRDVLANEHVTADFAGKTVDFFASGVAGRYAAIIGVDVKHTPQVYPLTVRSSLG